MSSTDVVFDDVDARALVGKPTSSGASTKTSKKRLTNTLYCTPVLV